MTINPIVAEWIASATHGQWFIGSKPYHGHWWSKGGHPTTIAPVLHRQISPKTKSPVQGFSYDMGMVTICDIVFIIHYQ